MAIEPRMAAMRWTATVQGREVVGSTPATRDWSPVSVNGSKYRNADCRFSASNVRDVSAVNDQARNLCVGTRRVAAIDTLAQTGRSTLSWSAHHERVREHAVSPSGAPRQRYILCAFRRHESFHRYTHRRAQEGRESPERVTQRGASCDKAADRLGWLKRRAKRWSAQQACVTIREAGDGGPLSGD